MALTLQEQTLIRDRFFSLPAVVQEAITTGDVERRLRELSQKHKLHLDAWQSLEDAVSLTLMGLCTPDELLARVEHDAHMDSDAALTLVQDISDTVFEPIQAELARSLGSPRAVEKVITPTQEIANTLLKAESETLETPPKLLSIRAESVVPHVPSSERKVIANDPYREQV